MSVHYSSKVWKLETDSLAEKLILLKLADNASDQGVCWPSVERMAFECQMDVRTAQRWIRTLEEKKWLEVTQRSGHSSIYKLILPDFTPGTRPPRQYATPSQDHHTPVTGSPPPPAHDHPEPSVEPSMIRQEGGAREESSEGQEPTIEEIIDFGNGGSAIPEAYCHHYHAKKSETHGWVKNQRLIDWRKEIVRWWVGDRGTEKWHSDSSRVTSNGQPATPSKPRLPERPDDDLQRLPKGFFTHPYIRRPARTGEFVRFTKDSPPELSDFEAACKPELAKEEWESTYRMWEGYFVR